MSAGIDKLEGSRRLIETAIELFFENKDSLSVHSLAYSAFKVLFDLYPHRSNDDFSKRLDQAIGREGWKSMSGIANFLKHADKDPDELMRPHHPMQGMIILVFAVILYRRISGELTLKMMAFDYWTDELAYDAIGIEELDENIERVAKFKEIRTAIQDLPFDAQIVIGKRMYEDFIKIHESAVRMIEEGKSKGLNLTQILDENLKKHED